MTGGFVTKYDVYIITPIRGSDQKAPEDDGERADLRQRGWLALDSDLETARETVRRVLEARGHAYVAPSEYRVPRVTIDDAREIAERTRRELNAQGRRLEPFSLEFDDIVWWTFVADDADAIARDIYPGQLHIAVDKLTGQIRTEDEFQRWLALSGLDLG